MKTCSNCKFYSALAQECHRNAPAVFPVPTLGGGISTMGAFPPTKADNWCGQHEEKADG